MFQFIQHGFQFLWTCILSEFLTVTLHAYYMLHSLIDPSSCMIPAKETLSHENNIVHVTILLPGQGAHPSCYIPMIRYLEKSGMDNVYAISYRGPKNKQDPVNDELLHEKLQKIADVNFSKGFLTQFTLVGHSLGSLVATRYVYGQKAQELEHATISQVISIAGRLRWLDETLPSNKMAWFAKPMEESIKRTYQMIVNNQEEQVPLYTIMGAKDLVVPYQSGHIQEKYPERMRTVNKVGHNGVLFAKETHEWVVELLKKDRVQEAVPVLQEAVTTK